MADRNRQQTGRKVYHVVPHPGPEPGWDVELERDIAARGAQGAHDHHNTKKEAVARGREMARPENGQLLIHKKDGTIQIEYTYGHDPYPPPG